MRRPEVPTEVGASLEALLDYNEADEAADYEQEHGEWASLADAEESHIYTHMQRIRAWLAGEEA